MIRYVFNKSLLATHQLIDRLLICAFYGSAKASGTLLKINKTTFETNEALQ